MMCSCCTFTVKPKLNLLSVNFIVTLYPLRWSYARQSIDVGHKSKEHKSFPCIHDTSYTQVAHIFTANSKDTTVCKIWCDLRKKTHNYSIGIQIKSFKCPSRSPVSSFIQVSYIRNQSSLLLKIPNSLKGPASGPRTICGGLGWEGVECVLYFITRTLCARSFSQKGLVERRSNSRVQNLDKHKISKPI